MPRLSVLVQQQTVRSCNSSEEQQCFFTFFFFCRGRGGERIGKLFPSSAALSLEAVI